VQVDRDNAVKETAVYRWVKCFCEGREVSLMKSDQDSQQQAQMKKTLQKFIKLCMKID
jgi:hypothetical protein